MAKSYKGSVFAYLMLLMITTLHGQSVFDYSGQAAVWAGINEQPQFWVGGRYLPHLQLKIPKMEFAIDFEAAANLWAGIQRLAVDSLVVVGDAQPYRLWGRFATDRMELRLGLQKINFGSASILRPMMWFDQLDPRDPLQLTDGVYAMLGRYYFQNNSNIWLWVVYPSKKLKTWEVFPSNKKFPEWGSRFQLPSGMGELAFSMHHRTASSYNNSYGLPKRDQFGETRFGLDGKWDLGAGVWFESVAVQQHKDLGQFNSQLLLTVGTDYTFGLGNGLHVMAEHLLLSSGKSFGSLNKGISFSALSIAYPLSMFDQILFLLYYDWNATHVYSFTQYSYNFGKWDLMLMAWMNPLEYSLPGQTMEASLYAGKGFQFMLIYHY